MCFFGYVYIIYVYVVFLLCRNVFFRVILFALNCDWLSYISWSTVARVTRSPCLFRSLVFDGICRCFFLLSFFVCDCNEIALNILKQSLNLVNLTCYARLVMSPTGTLFPLWSSCNVQCAFTIDELYFL